LSGWYPKKGREEHIYLDDYEPGSMIPCEDARNIVVHPRGEPDMRKFPSGATRDTDDGKYDYEAFFSPRVLHRRAEYMHKHRLQSDGTLRDGDNWQKGFPKSQTMKSAFRHFMEWWLEHRGQVPHVGGTGDRVVMQEAICALMFNCESYLDELLKERE
jgi:hypothetical protein